MSQKVPRRVRRRRQEFRMSEAEVVRVRSAAVNWMNWKSKLFRVPRWADIYPFPIRDQGSTNYAVACTPSYCAETLKSLRIPPSLLSGDVNYSGMDRFDAALYCINAVQNMTDLFGDEK